MDFFDEIVGTIDGIGIFVHNVMIALPMFIPGVGVVWGLFSAYSTGFAFSAIAAANADVAQLNPLAILLDTVWIDGDGCIFHWNVPKCLTCKKCLSKKLGFN